MKTICLLFTTFAYQGSTGRWMHFEMGGINLEHVQKEITLLCNCIMLEHFAFKIRGWGNGSVQHGRQGIWLRSWSTISHHRTILGITLLLSLYHHKQYSPMLIIYGVCHLGCCSSSYHCSSLWWELWAATASHWPIGWVWWPWNWAVSGYLTVFRRTHRGLKTDSSSFHFLVHIVYSVTHLSTCDLSAHAPKYHMNNGNVGMSTW